tara:strand:+ start:18085 stop:20823 length:2739 start_codon:yes stop_codon:yes gene_type:complete
MFSCSQNSRKPTIQNIINNYSGGGSGGSGGSSYDLSNIYLLINSLQSNITILETSFNTFSFEISGVASDIFNELSNNFYNLKSLLDYHFILDQSNLIINNDICLNNNKSINFYGISNEFISLKAPTDLSNSYILTFPKTFTEENSGNFLKIDKSGNLYFYDLSLDNPNSNNNQLLENNNYIKNIYNNENFSSNLNLQDTLKLIKNNDGFVINYYEPVNSFYSKRDNTHTYNDIDVYEKISYENILLYLNEKNILSTIHFNNKNYSIKSNQFYLINSYINNLYRGIFGSSLNIFSNDNYLKMLDKIIYKNSNENEISNYTNFVNSDHPNKDISFNEITKITNYGLTPPYYFDLSGTGLNDISNSIYYNSDISLNNIKLNLLNFGGIEYEQNISLIQNILKDSSNNVIFYFYIQNNFDNFIKLFSNDFSNNGNNINNYVNYKQFVLDNSNIITYNYGNLLFLVDEENSNIKANINNVNSIDISNNILNSLNLNNILLCDYSDLSNNNNNINDFIINHINNQGNTDNNLLINNYDDFSNVSLYNISKLSNSKILDYNELNNNNSLILCPLPDNNFFIDSDSNKFVDDINFKENVYKYISLFQKLYKDASNINYSHIISTNESDLANITFFDSSINFMFSNRNLYLTYYDLPNYINSNFNQNLLNELDLNINNRELKNGRLNFTKIYYPFYFDQTIGFLNNISNYVKNNELTNHQSNYNTKNVKNTFIKGYIQFLLVYLIIYLLQKYKNNNIESFSSIEISNFYNDLINNNIDLNSNLDLSNSLFVINQLFENNIYVDVNNTIIDFSYNLLINNNNLSTVDSSLNNNLKKFIYYKELFFAISSKILKLTKINDPNKKSFYTLYDLSNIKVKSGQITEENIYNIHPTDLSYSSLDDDFRYYLLNNWKQYYSNVDNYL